MMKAAYQKMHEALEATGRPIVFSLCQYGWIEVWKWGPEVGGNLWRTTGDIRDNCDRMIADRVSTGGSRPLRTPGPATGMIRTCWRSATAA